MANAARFSAFSRPQMLQKMADNELNLLVIGGGITGVGIALDAASRGLTVGLVEKGDFASGTSSRSTKLIHGGLRYLKQGEFKLVREVGRERSLLHRNAAHLVIPEKMLLPIVKDGTYGKLATSFGLWLYDRLAAVARPERRKMLTKEETMAQEPLLRQDILIGSGLYTEYRTDDARLTIEVAKTANQYGALCVNYAQAEDFLYEGGKILGANIRDVVTGKTYEIRAKKVVNATGPWVDELRAKDGSVHGKKIHLTKGVHIVVPHAKLPIAESVYFDVPDGRMVFAIPRGKTTYIGTTDTDYRGSLEKVSVEASEVDYLLNAANQMFPSARLSKTDVVSSWAGLRPLIHEEGKAPSELSRKDEIFISPAGLVTIAGGKLTGYRKMAERVVDVVLKQLREEAQAEHRPDARLRQPCVTGHIALSGGGFDNPNGIPSYIRTLIKDTNPRIATPEQIAALVYKYGTNTPEVLARAADAHGHDGTARLNSPALADANWPSRLLFAELHYGVDEEMVHYLDDFLLRRTGWLLFESETASANYSKLLVEMANLFGWDKVQEDEYRNQFEAAYL